MSTFRNPYAKRIKDGELVFIDDLTESERGLKCGCICPCCGEPMIAKMGDYNEHHFAHASQSDCLGGYETALHSLAKKVMEDGASMMLPAFKPVYSSNGGFFIDEEGILFKDYKSEPQVIVPDSDSVKTECSIGSIRPDVVFNYKGKALIVEFYVTHAVDEEKRNKIIDSGISAIEVDLTPLLEKIHTKKDVRDFIEKDTIHRKWIYNSKCKDSIVESLGDNARVLETTNKEITEGKRLEDLGVQLTLSASNVVGCPRSLLCGGEPFSICKKCKYFKGCIHKIKEYGDETIVCGNSKEEGKPTQKDVCDFISSCVCKVENLPPEATLDDYVLELDKKLWDLRSEYKEKSFFENRKKKAIVDMMCQRFRNALKNWVFEIDRPKSEMKKKDRIEFKFIEKYPAFEFVKQHRKEWFDSKITEYFDNEFQNKLNNIWRNNLALVKNSRKEKDKVDELFDWVSLSIKHSYNESFIVWFVRCLVELEQKDISFDFRDYMEVWRRTSFPKAYYVSIVPYMYEYAWEKHKTIWAVQS